jgi:hypothetical protein
MLKDAGACRTTATTAMHGRRAAGSILRACMGEITIIGIDLAKNVSQVHGAAADGTVMFRTKVFARNSPGSMPVAIEPVDHLNLY